MDKNKISRNFSSYAGHYDKYCTIQNLCASKLIDKTGPGRFGKILDIGCGTGNYTRKLKDKYPDARIKAVDISQKMVEIAREKLKCEGIEFVVSDAETSHFEDGFDLITSNACFQWFDNPGMAIAKYKGLLGGAGVILFSMFGPLTFNELSKSVEASFGGDAPVISRNFMEYAEIERVTKRLFRKVECEQEIFEERPASLQELLKKIKYTGSGGNGATRKGLWTPRAMNLLEETYRKMFKEIVVTYQVFFFKGVK
jgi:malonyl-CoA O-methyltransferase